MSSTASIQIDRPFRFAIPKDAEKDEAYSNATQEGLIEGDKATARTDDAVDALDSIRRCRKSNCVSSARGSRRHWNGRCGGQLRHAAGHDDAPDDTVFIDAILVPLLRELGLPETLPLIKLSPRMQESIVAEAEELQHDAMAHATVAVLVRNGLPLTRENYLNLNNVDEDDLDAEQESELPQLFQQSMVEYRGGR
jgi:hypothetical protein